MKKIDFGQAIGILANVGVIAGIVFLAIEIRTSTEINRIAIQQNLSGNWLLINSQIASDADLAALIEKAFSGEELQAVEAQQFGAYVREYVTQSNMMLKLYDQGLITEDEVRSAFRATRDNASNNRFRQEIEAMRNERLRGLILDHDGLDRWQMSVIDVRSWPFLPFNEGFNGAESDFRFVPESGRSECWDIGSSLWLLLAESRHSLTVNMQAAAYLGEKN